MEAALLALLGVIFVVTVLAVVLGYALPDLSEEPLERDIGEGAAAEREWHGPDRPPL